MEPEHEPSPPGENGVLPREAAMRRLMARDAECRLRLGSPEVALVAAGMGVSPRTVWRWVQRGRAGGGLGRMPRNHFVVTDALRERLAFWRGNVVAVHRELVEAARAGGPPAPSRATLARAVARDVLQGTVSDGQHPVRP